MKKCPKCNRNYSDESLNFCLDDGAVLNVALDLTTNENIGRPTEQQTEILSQQQVTEYLPTDKTENYDNESETVVKSQSANKSQPQIIQQGVSPMFAYLSVGLLAVLVLLTGIGVISWISYNSDRDGRIASANSNSNNTNQLPGDLNRQNTSVLVDNKNVETSKPKAPLRKETQKPTPKSKPTVIPTSKPTTKPTATPTPSSGKYFVVLGSFPKSQATRAAQRLKKARSAGLPAKIVNTNNHPGLRNGFLAVVMGPFSKSSARSALGRARSVSPDAYVKRG